MKVEIERGCMRGRLSFTSLIETTPVVGFEIILTAPGWAAFVSVNNPRYTTDGTLFRWY